MRDEWHIGIYKYAHVVICTPGVREVQMRLVGQKVCVVWLQKGWIHPPSIFILFFCYKWSWKTAQPHFYFYSPPKLFFLWFFSLIVFLFSFLLTQCHYFSIEFFHFTPLSKYYKSLWGVRGTSAVAAGSCKACRVTVEITWFGEKGKYTCKYLYAVGKWADKYEVVKVIPIITYKLLQYEGTHLIRINAAT